MVSASFSSLGDIPPLSTHGLPPLIFVTADDRLMAATRGEAVTAEHANLHP
jgi:hypothetical protein